MIGKESIAFNDRAGIAGDFLEKLLDFYFKLHAQKPKRGKRAQANAHVEQDLLGMADVRGEKTVR